MRKWCGIFAFFLTLLPLNDNWSLSGEHTANPDPVEMIIIPAGSFMRGTGNGEGRQDEHPRQDIYLNSFAIDKFEVTNARYLRFVQETSHKPPMNVYGEGPLEDVPGIADLPVVQVTWHDAVDYCFWTGKRLPTEAEWEKAARGTKGQLYPWGNEPADHTRANYDREWEDIRTLLNVTTVPEGQSPYGVYHLSGNVREWVHDWYSARYYQFSPSTNPRGPDSGIVKVIRGGSWRSFDSDIRTSARGKGGFALKTHGVGFRCAQDLSPTRTHTHNQ